MRPEIEANERRGRTNGHNHDGSDDRGHPRGSGRQDALAQPAPFRGPGGHCLERVLGLLIWTAYGVYNGQNLAVQTLAAKVLQLDFALEDYGPEARGGRALLRQELAKTIDAIWNADVSDSQFAAHNFAAAISNLRHQDGLLKSLDPSTDRQKQALAEAAKTINSIGQSRLQMSFALSGAVSYPLVYVVVGWGVALFCGFGLMSKGNAMSVVALIFGAVAVASAIYLILDLSSPYSGGLFRASPAALQQVLAQMGRGQGAVGGSR